MQSRFPIGAATCRRVARRAALLVCLAPAAPALAGPDFVRIAGGAFDMGDADFYAEEQPVHRVTVSPFEIARTEVTNDEFAAFVAATGYVTTAERALDPAAYPGWPAELLAAGSMVFSPPEEAVGLDNPLAWWRYVAGADWRRPTGPGSDIEGRGDHPVVHVSSEDAEAYAAWIGGRLPTEAEWEFAARGGLDGARYAWGEAYNPVEGWKANTWQGRFPAEDKTEDGFAGTAPVGSFPPNGYGLSDMAGNVWEHVADWWVPGHPDRPGTDPEGPPEAFAAQFSHPDVGAMRVVKGGSWLCAPSYCLRYRPAARQSQELSLGSNHIGFRVARDVD